MTSILSVGPPRWFESCLPLCDLPQWPLSFIFSFNHKSKDIITYIYGVYVSMYACRYLCSYVCTANISESTLGFFIDNTFYLHQKYQNIVSKKMSFFVACGKFECSLPQNCAILHLMISSNDFLWNTLACWKTTDKSNANIIQFSPKILFLCKWEIHWFRNGIKG